jgi:ATP synthase subunit 6
VPISIVQQIFETFLLFIIRIVKQQVGNLGFIYTPLILSLFFSILFCNLLSLTPFSVALTSHISLVAFITFIVNFSIFYQGLINNDSKFLSLFVPSSPLFLLLLLIPIELFSYSIRALSMGIRLTANIIAGHTLVFIVSNFLIKIFLTKVFFFFYRFFIIVCYFFTRIWSFFFTSICFYCSILYLPE